MTISFENGIFIARSIFDENDILKGAGFKWNPETKRWYSESHHVAEKLLKYCDNTAIFQIRFVKEGMQKSVLESASSEGKGKYPIYHPQSIKPFPYQVAGVEYILPRPAVILADEMGLGKTGQALLVMNMRHPVEALIVCPSILKYNWLKEARKWMIGKITAYVYESKKIRLYEGRITNHNKNTILHIINYDILEKFKERLMGIPFNFFVADECHYIKNGDSKRSKISQELANKAKWKIFITGTPIYNKPKDLFVSLNLIDPVMFGNFFSFASRYCGARKVKFNNKSVMQYGAATNVDELNTILRANYMVRRMKKDVLKDLPDKLKDVIILNESDLDVLVQKEKKAVEDSAKEEERLKAEAEELKKLAANDKQFEELYKNKVKSLREIKFKNFGELSRIRKEIALKKVPYVIEFVKEMLDNNEDPQSKIVIFGHHKEVLQKIYQEMKKYNPVIITGEVSDGERQRAIMMFKEKNTTRVFVGSMGAAGTGVDGLQQNCNTIVFAELDWTPALVDQAESRLQRIGQKNTVWVYHIVANESIDSRIIKLMMEKEKVSKEILDYRPEQIYEEILKKN
jgi:SWI/SNF-related matrix-associated actin-dependent regulator 1 of chromatin subfamily A